MARRTIRWNPPATYPAGSDAWSAQPTKVAPGSTLLTPGQPDPAEYLNWLYNTMCLDSVKGSQRASLNAMQAVAVGAQVKGVTGIALQNAVAWAQPTTNNDINRSRGTAAYTKVASLAGVQGMHDFGVAPGQLHLYSTAGGGAQMLAGVQTAFTGSPTWIMYRTGQVGSNVVGFAQVSSGSGAACIVQSWSGTAWSTTTSPSGAILAGTSVASYDLAHPSGSVGPIAFIPRYNTIGGASYKDYFYSTDAVNMLKGDATGLPATSVDLYVGCGYDEATSLWVMCTFHASGAGASNCNFYTSSTVAGPWTSATGAATVTGLTNTVELTFTIINGVWLLAGGPESGLVNDNTTQTVYHMALAFSLDAGATWEFSNADLPVLASPANLRITRVGDRVAISNDLGICISGSLA